MAERYFQIQNFKWGLEARKSELITQAGALASVVNGLVNSGGEIEQRKSFARDATGFPTNTFGLEAVASGLLTFGSDAAPNSALPTGVTYQRLISPSIYIPSTHPAVPDSMQAVVFSCNYLGNAFVVATFTSGTFCFYNGSLVTASRSGVVLQYNDPITGTELPQDLASDLASLINAVSGWLADANKTASVDADASGLHETAQNGSVLVMSPGNIHFAPVFTNNSVAGLIGGKLLQQNYGGIAAKSASVAFTLNAGTNGTVEVKVGAISLTNGTVAFTTNLNTTAAAVAAAINAATIINGGYIATVSTATVTVVAPTSLGNFTSNLTVVTTGDITTVVGAVANTFTITVTPAGVSTISSGTGGATLHGVAAASTSGATGATGVTYAWIEVNSDGSAVTTPSGIAITSTTAASVTFSKSLATNSSVLGYFKCTATDTGAGAQVNHPFQIISVYFERDSIN